MTNVFASDAAGGGLTPAPAPLFEPGPPPTSLEVWGAAFGYENTIASAIDFISKPVFPVEPDYNPQTLIAGTKFESLYGDSFTGDRSAAETRWRMAKIEEEERQRATLAAGGWEGILAGMTAGILDPLTVIPVGGWMRASAKGAAAGLRASRAIRTALVPAVKRGGFMGTAAAVASDVAAGVATRAPVLGAGAVESGLGGAFAAGLHEALLQSTQEGRPAVESLYNIAAASILSGAIGGVARMSTRP